jgi:Na+/phosphate symporter
MEEKELNQRFHNMFEKMTPILEDMKKGFFTQNNTILKESEKRFREILKSALPFAEKLIEEKEKDEVEKRYVNLVLPVQMTALALENLIEKMHIKVESHILFSEKALNEIKELFAVMESQFIDTKDYILTKNPHLKNNIKSGKEKIIKMANEYALVHEQRLITGVCMPKASYLYIDITDSLKRIARGLFDFAEKV